MPTKPIYNMILFMPYDPDHRGYASARYEYSPDGPESMQKNRKVMDFESSLGHSPLPVWYDGKKNPHVSSFTTGHIFIRGHGMPGFLSIEGGRGGERVSYIDVAKRLIKSGLPKSYQGEIVCYVCHSGETGNSKGSIDPEMHPNGQPFAQSLANYLYSKGYKSCSYYGYLGSMDSFAKEGSKGKTYYSRGMSNGKQEELGTHAQARVKFRPTVEMRPFFSRIFK